LKQFVRQTLDFFKKHKYGRLSAVALLGVLFIAGAFYIRSMQQEPPLALSDVADAISAGKVEKIEDTTESGSLTILYKDGSTHTSRRDQASSFLEQITYLGVSESEMARVEYTIVEPGMFTGEKGTSALISLLMLGMAAFVITRIAGGRMLPTQKNIHKAMFRKPHFRMWLEWTNAARSWLTS